MKIIDYIDSSANKLSGYHIQDDGGNWGQDFDNTPKWYDKDRSFGLNVGKYLYRSGLNTAAIELGYLPPFHSNIFRPQPTGLLKNEYSNVFTLDLVLKSKINDSLEIFGSTGKVSMNILGSQNVVDNGTFDRDEEGKIYKDGPRYTSKLGLGSGLLYKLSDKLDLKLTYKNLGNITTNRMAAANDGRDVLTNRKLGFAKGRQMAVSAIFKF